MRYRLGGTVAVGGGGGGGGAEEEAGVALVFFLRFACVRVAIALVLELFAPVKVLENEGIGPSPHYGRD